VGILICRTTVGEKEIRSPNARAALICGRRRFESAVEAGRERGHGWLIPHSSRPPRFRHRDRRVGGKVGLPDCRDQVVWGITVSRFIDSVRADLGWTASRLQRWEEDSPSSLLELFLFGSLLPFPAPTRGCDMSDLISVVISPQSHEEDTLPKACASCSLVFGQAAGDG